MKEFKIVQTCGACPEQYDVYKDDRYVAFLHLRHGSFGCEYNGKWIYTSNPKGDGIFDSEQERIREINAALQKLKEVMENEIEEPLYECGVNNDDEF